MGAFSPANVPPSPLLLGTVDLTPAPGTSLTECEPRDMEPVTWWMAHAYGVKNQASACLCGSVVD